MVLGEWHWEKEKGNLLWHCTDEDSELHWNVEGAVYGSGGQSGLSLLTMRGRNEWCNLVTDWLNCKK